jgi:hypothetical protein
LHEVLGLQADQTEEIKIKRNNKERYLEAMLIGI